MPEFFNVQSPQQAFEALLPHLVPIRDTESIPTTEAMGRVIAEDIESAEDLPTFARATMDGFSVRARDSFGASESLPAPFSIVADIPTGQQSNTPISSGEAAVAYTGGMLAGGADAVVMVERTQPVDEISIEVLRPVAPGENVVQIGEDVRSGDLLFGSGHRIRPQDIGGLLAVGITRVRVRRRPKIAIVSTGDEIVAPGENPPPGKIRDINTYTMAARATQCGATIEYLGLVRDDYNSQLEAARTGLSCADILVFSAGSSLSTRDMTAAVFNELGDPGVIVHGISIKPGKPTVVGAAQGKPLFGLPGNPVSALVVFGLLVAPAIGVLSGDLSNQIYAVVPAILAEDLPSESGREDYIPVLLSGVDGCYSATPVLGKSNLIYTLVNSDGIVRVPSESGGLYAGAGVDVRLYRS